MSELVERIQTTFESVMRVPAEKYENNVEFRTPTWDIEETWKLRPRL